MAKFKGIELTEEQMETIKCVRTGQDTKVQAPAGSGKTFTLEAAAAAMPDRKGFYLAFNKAIADSAKQKFNSNVDARTGHSVAFGAVGRKYADRLSKITGTLIAKTIQIGDTSAYPTPNAKGYVILDTIRRFTFSKDKYITDYHVPVIKGPFKDEDMPFLRKDIVPYANAVWEDMINVKGVLPITHDVYLKLWALGNPIIDKDFILFDEAQDANAVILDLVGKQNAQTIFVGDKFQQIYEWRGATNAMESINTTHSTFITQSFRFGQEIADMANNILGSYLSPEDRPPLIKGLEGKSGLLSMTPLENPDVIICRTNAGVISNIFKLLEEDKKVYVQGGVTMLINMLNGAKDLQRNKRTYVPDLALFGNWQEVIECSKTESGADLRSLVHMVEKYGVEKLMMALRQCCTMSQTADITLTTAHKCVLPSTYVETLKGTQCIKDIEINGVIASPTGMQLYKDKFKKVTGEVIKITTKEGFFLGISLDHGMTIWNGSGHVRIEGRDLKEEDVLRLYLGAMNNISNYASLKNEEEGGYCNESKYTFPELLTENVAEFLGLMTGDGTLHRKGFNLGKRYKSVPERFCSLTTSLFGKIEGVSVKEKSENFYLVEINSTQISRWIKLNFGTDFDPYKKKVPQHILNSSLNVQACYLRGLFEDGGVSIQLLEDGTERLDTITLTQKNVEMINTIQYMLLKQGIVSSVRHRCDISLLYIYGKHIKTYRDKIGFIADEKNEILYKTKIREQGTDFIPITKEECKDIGRQTWIQLTGKVQNYENARLRGRVNKDHVVMILQGIIPYHIREKLEERMQWYYSPIAKLERSEEETYCVTVPEGERFLQNGFDGWNSKGLEWQTVKLHSDFVSPAEDKHLERSECNLLYVAASRALTNLDISNCVPCHADTLSNAKNNY